MRIIAHLGFIEIREWERFSPLHTFGCGQCFRWFVGEDGRYSGVAFGRKLTLWAEGDVTYMTCTKEEFERVWRHYFDADRRYEIIAQSFKGDAYFRQAVDFGLGLRLLQQDSWEALCSFILSQCNNITRIQQIIATLCREFGENKGDYDTFPSAQQVAQLTLEDLAVLRSGYRAKYVLAAAQAVASGRLSFETLGKMDTEQARKEVMKCNGVGRKVADCFLLFGLGKYDAFPVDTWMKKAEGHYEGFGENFGQYAGIAQQYLFYYARSGQNNKKGQE